MWNKKDLPVKDIAQYGETAKNCLRYYNIGLMKIQLNAVKNN